MPLLLSKSKQANKLILWTCAATSLLGCDLLLSLFFTALSSYRRATICQPFPSLFSTGTLHTKIKDFDQLVPLVPLCAQAVESDDGASLTLVMALSPQVQTLHTLPPLSALAADEGAALLPCPALTRIGLMRS
jgi:hypothetical protein